jgi:hypothetical protein
VKRKGYPNEIYSFTFYSGALTLKISKVSELKKVSGGAERI